VAAWRGGDGRLLELFATASPTFALVDCQVGSWTLEDEGMQGGGWRSDGRPYGWAGAGVGSWWTHAGVSDARARLLFLFSSLFLRRHPPSVRPEGGLEAAARPFAPLVPVALC